MVCEGSSRAVLQTQYSFWFVLPNTRVVMCVMCQTAECYALDLATTVCACGTLTLVCAQSRDSSVFVCFCFLSSLVRLSLLLVVWLCWGRNVRERTKLWCATPVLHKNQALHYCAAQTDKPDTGVFVCYIVHACRCTDLRPVHFTKCGTTLQLHAGVELFSTSAACMRCVAQVTAAAWIQVACFGMST